MLKHTTYLFLLVGGLLLSGFTAKAQGEYLGIWHGYVTASVNGIPLPNSGLALIVKEQVGDMIAGKGYIYGTDHVDFDGLLDFIGTIDSTTSRITELKILKYKEPNKITELCIKYMTLGYSKKDTTQYLTGRWEGYYIDRDNKSRLPCNPGKVYLKKFNPESPDDLMPIPKEVFTAIEKDRNEKPTFFNTQLAEPIVVNVRNTALKLSVRDYLREDNDTVSVYLNRRPVLSKQLIKKKPITLSLRLYKGSELNELVLYAENLGLVPPNTSVLTIDDGETKQNLVIRSTDQVSAVVHLRYTGHSKAKNPPITK